MTNLLHGRFTRLARALEPYEFTLVPYQEQHVHYNNTVFLYHPPAEYVWGSPDVYEDLRTFFYYHKRGQRRVLNDHFDVPTRHDECDPPWVVRPVNHFGGAHFHVASTEGELREAARHIQRHSSERRWYASKLFRRTREFRSFFVGGHHVTTMLKRIEGVGYAQADNMPDPDKDDRQMRPWNRCETGDTQYMTIHRDRNNKLLQTSFFDDAASFFEVYPFDLLAVDVGYNDHNDEYRVFEVNFAPELTVESSLTPIANALDRLRE